MTVYALCAALHRAAGRVVSECETRDERNNVRRVLNTLLDAMFDDKTLDDEATQELADIAAFLNDDAS